MSTLSETGAAGSAPGVGAGAADAPPPEERAETALARTLQSIARSDLLVVVMSFVFAFLIGSVLIVIADEEVRTTLGYFFARPSDALTAIWQSVTHAYGAMFRGAVFDGPGFSRVAEDVREAGGSGTYVLFPALAAGSRPLTETLTVATPLIIAAAGMAVSFRAGLFNIGGTGQLIVGAMAAGYVGFAVQLPVVLHLLVALLAGVLAGGVWGGIAGFLKARFGANEVISTIMLNWIATYLLFFALKTTAFTGANQSQPTSPSVGENATLPLLLGGGFRLHAGLFLAAGAAVLLWWLMSRSTLGFHFRAVGSNPRAARVAGISPARTAFLVLAVAGALVGLAGAVHVLGTERRLTEGVAGNIGFDAITVAAAGPLRPRGHRARRPALRGPVHGRALHGDQPGRAVGPRAGHPGARGALHRRAAAGAHPDRPAPHRPPRRRGAPRPPHPRRRGPRDGRRRRRCLDRLRHRRRDGRRPRRGRVRRKLLRRRPPRRRARRRGAPPGDAPPTGASGTGTHARQDPSDGTAPAPERGEDTTDAQEDHR
ncbi:ABC transporter permease [Brachybacterium sp. GPGPB12]|uniref:ABC transporter permease n=1 Tax=Brachybacterium sp. GPGPB12 TaxID=3023517 RepID=UPI0031343898